jgi:hypothetical protein
MTQPINTIMSGNLSRKEGTNSWIITENTHLFFAKRILDELIDADIANMIAENEAR